MNQNKGQRSSGDNRYQTLKMTDRERKRKAIFEDFRSRIISQAQLKIELDELE